MQKRSACITVLASVALLTMAAVPAFSQVDLPGQSNTRWRVYNYEPGISFLWDIDPAQKQDIGLRVPIALFQSTTSGSFVVYLSANYNRNITGKVFSTAFSWLVGVYKTRSTTNPSAYVRFWFQDVASGPYSANDYWFSTGTTTDNTQTATNNSLDLNSATSYGELEVPLTDRSRWTNLCGKSANDQTTYTGPDCLGGVFPAESPYDGFTRAMKNVKQLGLAFGNSGSYASGVAREGQGTVALVTKFTITTPAP